MFPLTLSSFPSDAPQHVRSKEPRAPPAPQVDLEIGAFELHVTRRTEAAAAAPAPAPVEYAAPVPAPAAPVASTAISEDETDEEDASHVLVLAPTVGVMRRGKYVKGKQVGKGNAAEEGDTVKKGQVLGYVEKLGTFEPVLSPQAGEVSAFLVDEGEPVSYNDPVVELSPFFG